MENTPLSPLRKKLKETSYFLMDILYNAVVIIVLVIIIRSFLVSPFRVVGHSMADTLHDKEFILIDKLSYIIGDIDRGDPIVFLPPALSSDSPKFELTAKTDANGLAKVAIENLEASKQSNYCKSRLLAAFWFCKSQPIENDFIYFAPESQALSTSWETVEKQILTENDVKNGYLRISADPNQTYVVRIYDAQGLEYFVKRVIGIPGDTVKIADGKVYLKEPQAEEFHEINEPFLNQNNYQKTLVNQRPDEKIFEVPEGHYFVLGDNRGASNDSRSWLEPITQEPFPFVPEENISGKVLIVLWPLSDLRFIESVDF